MQINLKNPELQGLADQALNAAVVSINFSLKTLITRTADTLDVGQSRIRLEFRRSKEGIWGWVARLRDERGKTLKVSVALAPIEALATLVEKIKTAEGSR